MDPIKLDEIEFWRLKARVETAKRHDAEANATPQALAARHAWQLAGAAFEEVARTHGFDANLLFEFDEATWSLVPVTPQTPPK
jgi:hypothetical protein